jgi:hypothetical protein
VIQPGTSREQTEGPNLGCVFEIPTLTDADVEKVANYAKRVMQNCPKIEPTGSKQKEDQWRFIGSDEFASGASNKTARIPSLFSHLWPIRCQTKTRQGVNLS